MKVSINCSKVDFSQDGFYIKQIAKEINKNSLTISSISIEKFLQIDSKMTIMNLYIK